MDTVSRLRSYKNGVHGVFFMDAADEIEALKAELSGANCILHRERKRAEKAEAERDRLLTIAIRERTWRLEQDECGGDEINESIDKLKYEAINHKEG